MNPLCYELLEGTLVWNGNTGPYTGKITNNLPIPVTIGYVRDPAKPMPFTSGYPRVIPPLGIAGFGSDDQAPGYYKVTVPGTGALVAVYDLSAGQPDNYILDKSSLNVPNDIGPIPVPSSSIKGAKVHPQPHPPRPDSTIIVPPDSGGVLVGCGVAANGNLLVREQYWKRQNDSICLAGNETRTVSYTVTSGKQQTSSDSETVAASINTNISAGWGPVAASISASLGVNSTSFQQITVTEQATSTVSHTVHNPYEQPVAFFRWQLMDVITVLSSSGVALSSIIQGENPTIAMGPYWVAGRPQPPEGEAGLSGLFEYNK